jgi:tetratricopeptide (TPR) repeat protein
MTTHKSPRLSDSHQLFLYARGATKPETAYFDLRRTTVAYSSEDWAALARQFRSDERFAASSAAFRIAADVGATDRANLYLDAARDALKCGKLQISRMLARTALIDSREARVLAAAGVVLCSSGDMRGAAAVLLEAAEAHPNSPAIWSRLAAIDSVHGSRSRAVDYARNAVRSAPENRELLLEFVSKLLWLFDESSQPELLVEAKRLLDQASSMQGPANSLALRRAGLLSRSGRSDEGIAVAAQAMREGDPENSLALWIILEKAYRQAPWASLKASFNRSVGHVFCAMHESRFGDAYRFLKDVDRALRDALYIPVSTRRRYLRRLRRAKRQVRSAESRSLRADG